MVQQLEQLRYVFPRFCSLSICTAVSPLLKIINGHDGQRGSPFVLAPHCPGNTSNSPLLSLHSWQSTYHREGLLESSVAVRLPITCGTIVSYVTEEWLGWVSAVSDAYLMVVVWSAFRLYSKPDIGHFQ